MPGCTGGVPPGSEYQVLWADVGWDVSWNTFVTPLSASSSTRPLNCALPPSPRLPPRHTRSSSYPYPTTPTPLRLLDPPPTCSPSCVLNVPRISFRSGRPCTCPGAHYHTRRRTAPRRTTPRTLNKRARQSPRGKPQGSCCTSLHHKSRRCCRERTSSPHSWSRCKDRPVVRRLRRWLSCTTCMRCSWGLCTRPGNTSCPSPTNMG